MNSNTREKLVAVLEAIGPTIPQSVNVHGAETSELLMKSLADLKEALQKDETII